MGRIILDSLVSNFFELVYPGDDLRKYIPHNDGFSMFSSDLPATLEGLKLQVFCNNADFLENGEFVRSLEINQLLILSV
jgi:hypothetical protein